MVSNPLSARKLPPSVVDAFDRPDVRRWVASRMSEGHILRIDVLHEESKTGILSVGGVKDEDALVRALCEAMTDDAEGREGEHKYLVSCYRAPDDPAFQALAGQVQSSRTFRFGVETSEQEYERNHERVLMVQAVAMARNAQLHTEEMHKIALQSAKDFRSVDLAEKEALRKRLSDAEDKVNRAQEMMFKANEMMRGQETKALEARMADRVHQMAFQVLEQATPLVMGRLLPGGASAAGTAPLQSDLLRDFFEDLTPKQIREITERVGLDPLQLAALAELRTAYAEGKIPPNGDAILDKLLLGENGLIAQSDKLLAIDRILRRDPRCGEAGSPHGVENCSCQSRGLEQVFKAYLQRKAERDAAKAKDPCGA